jgi:phosphatidylglycerophosphate synthase
MGSAEFDRPERTERPRDAATRVGGIAAASVHAYTPRPLTEGELWAAEALLELRRRRYRPTAWGEFIRRSLERAEETRTARPLLAREARRWGAIGAAAWLAACRLARRHSSVSVNPWAGLLWWASVWKMLDWHLGMAEGGDGRRRKSLSAADAVTLARFWVVPLAPAVRRSRYGLPALVVLGGVSDWLDGALARRVGQTRLGRDLDTTADLAFLGSAAAAASAAGRLPRLGAWALGARYGVGTTLALGAEFGRARRPALRARPWGAALRVGGLALASAGSRRAGTAILVTGCLVPPRSTSSGISVLGCQSSRSSTAFRSRLQPIGGSAELPPAGPAFARQPPLGANVYAGPQRRSNDPRDR